MDSSTVLDLTFAARTRGHAELMSNPPHLPLTIKIDPPLTMKIYAAFTGNVPSSFAPGRESAREETMNQTLFVIGDWPVHLTDALIAFAALALLLLLTIAIVVARSGKRDALLAQVQAARSDELEERLNDMMRAQAEASGRVDAMAQALSGRQ